MGTSHRNSRGFTLIAALLMTVLLSGVAVGLLYHGEQRNPHGRQRSRRQLAYYGAEAGIENLTSQISTLIRARNLPTLPPSMP